MARTSLSLRGRRVIRGLAGVLFVASMPALATDLRWTCWYEASDETVRCRMDGMTMPVADASGADAQTANLIDVLPVNMPAFARDLRLYPARFAGQEIVVPLFAPPESTADAQFLAQAVMCGSRTACTAVVLPLGVHADALDLVDSDDPALN